MPAGSGNDYYVNSLGIEFGVPFTSNLAEVSHGGLNDPMATSFGGTVTTALTAVTPEPSSFLLLCTGMLGFAGMGKRRFV